LIPIGFIEEKLIIPMKANYNTLHVDLINVLEISRGNELKKKKYLQQFIDLIPTRIEKLKQSLEAEDRVAVRKILHNMSPQLQFFKVEGVGGIIKKIEFEFHSMPMAELRQLTNQCIGKLTLALEEVNQIIDFQKE